tara:strand:- start:205 stop:1065 length:861 start_codon:yes stop_codon:yes gene_type:complete
MEKLLTIGMATYDDFDGVYFSIQALRLYHEICNTDAVEIIVVDNNPDGEHGKAIQSFAGWYKGLKYIPYKEKASTANRGLIFENAAGKYCISMDCHVMFSPGAIENLLQYYHENKNCKDLVQGPMVYDNLTGLSTHFKPTWGGDMYGQWDKDDQGLRTGKAFDIPMMGLGAFSCETKNWVGFNPHFKGFGGEEGYLHEKFRQNGGRSVCLPSFQWIHRFARPNGVKYPLILEDRIWNYFIGWLELKKDVNDPMIKEIYDYFKTRIPEASLNNILNNAASTIGVSNV